MKNIGISIICFSVVMMLFGGSVLAQTQFEKGLQKSGNRAGYADAGLDAPLMDLVAPIVKTVLSIVGVLFLALMIYGGYVWMLARGNEQEIEKAKKIITATIIGIIIVLAAYAITMFVGSVYQ